jgi:taurine dioxygenase
MFFHTDKCYHRRPHRATFLYGTEIPSDGGDTRFSSMYAAYDRLPAELKKKLEGKMVMQGYEYGLSSRISLDHELKNIHHCSQPMILTNPSSGRKGLYVASVNTMWIEGMERDESEAILQQCFAIAENDEIIYNHKWRIGDLLMWDNLACLHARTDWPKEQTRTLRRCTVEGDPLY